jgi:hypothetical protein
MITPATNNVNQTMSSLVTKILAISQLTHQRANKIQYQNSSTANQKPLDPSIENCNIEKLQQQPQQNRQAR